MNQFDKFYDWLNGVAESCTELIDYESIRDKKNMFIISVIEEARLKTFLDGLLQVNPDIKLTILVQDYVADGFKKNFGERSNVVSWQGRYTTGVIDVAGDEAIDSFVFFSDFSVNLRDQNYLEIAEAFHAKNEINTFCCTIGNDIYRYKNLQLYRQALKVYEDVSTLVDYYLGSKDKGIG